MPESEEKNENQQIHYTSSGEEIRFRPSGTVRFSKTFTAIVRLGITGGLAYWTAPAIQTYFESRKIISPASLLERFQLSEQSMFWIMVGWCVLLAYWAIASIIEIVKINIQMDRFLLRSDGFSLRRGLFGSETHFKSYEPLDFRLRPSDGALEGKTNAGTFLMTRGGTSFDRDWLIETLMQRYRFPEISIGTATRESVATYIVERRPDQSVLITSSAFSRYGCATIAAVLIVILVGVAFWLLKSGNGGGFIPLMFCIAIAVGGLSSLNSRRVEASPGHLRVQWKSPVGRFLKQFRPGVEPHFHHPFSEGEYHRESGFITLKTITRNKGGNNYQIVIRTPTDPEEDLEEAELEDDLVTEEEDLDDDDFDYLQKDSYIEEVVLDFTGETSFPSAEYILKLLLETTNFEESHARKTSK